MRLAFLRQLLTKAKHQEQAVAVEPTAANRGL
jgi:hypothetical protein